MITLRFQYFRSAMAQVRREAVAGSLVLYRLAGFL
jgi:hypothetical protein